MCQNRTRIGLIHVCREAISSPKMLTTSTRFWFWPHNFGIRISRKNVMKSINFRMDNQNINVNSKHIEWYYTTTNLNLLPLDDNATVKMISLADEWSVNIESCSCRICAYHIVCYMCNDRIDSFHCRFTTTSRDAACFIDNKEHAFESGIN